MLYMLKQPVLVEVVEGPQGQQELLALPGRPVLQAVAAALPEIQAQLVRQVQMVLLVPLGLRVQPGKQVLLVAEEGLQAIQVQLAQPVQPVVEADPPDQREQQVQPD
jgi:hypothetical protein